MNGAHRTYAEPRHGTSVDCAISLASQYVTERIAALQHPANEHAQQFLRRWGAEHHQHVTEWLAEAQQALQP